MRDGLLGIGDRLSGMEREAFRMKTVRTEKRRKTIVDDGRISLPGGLAPPEGKFSERMPPVTF
jgi:hypothetical protein